jgi:hypothetical protein
MVVRVMIQMMNSPKVVVLVVVEITLKLMVLITPKVVVVNRKMVQTIKMIPKEMPKVILQRKVVVVTILMEQVVVVLIQKLPM